jgi:hypothetical protein
MTREIVIAETKYGVKFHPVNVEHGEEIFLAPTGTSYEAILAAWEGYEDGQVQWMDLSSGAWWGE